MKGYELLERAVRLLGREQLDENIKIIGLTLLSAVAEEMGYMPPDSLSEKIPFRGEADRMTAIYGLGALIANAWGEGDTRAAFSDCYNRRLAVLRGRKSTVKEKMFREEEI